MTTHEARKIESEVQYYTASEAARTLEVSPTAVYGWIAEGLLDEVAGVKGRTRLVTADSVHALKAKREAKS